MRSSWTQDVLKIQLQLRLNLNEHLYVVGKLTYGKGKIQRFSAGSASRWQKVAKAAVSYQCLKITVSQFNKNQLKNWFESRLDL